MRRLLRRHTVQRYCTHVNYRLLAHKTHRISAHVWTFHAAREPQYHPRGVRRGGSAGVRLEPELDIRPTTQIPIIRMKDGKRELLPVRWGIVPPWEAEPKTKYSTFNAKAETITEKATYKNPFKKKRCLVVADGYDEWKVVGGTEKKPIKQRHHIHFLDDRLFAFAGLWEHWERDGKACDSATIIITSANPQLANIHERMPVILHKEEFPLWLDPEFEAKDKLLSLLKPYPEDELVATAI